MLTRVAAPLLFSEAFISVAFRGNSCLQNVVYIHGGFWYLGTCLFYEDLVDRYCRWKYVIAVLCRRENGSELFMEGLLKTTNASN